MKAIILAAGMGKRLLPLTKDKPKSMVRVLGKSLIEHTIDSLARKKVSEIIIVVGYCKDKIIGYFGDSYKGIKLTYVHNDDYAKTNNIYSLKLGLEKINEDLILCEGDVLFEPSILDGIDKNPDKNLVFVDKHQAHMDGTIIKYDKANNRITEFTIGADQGEDYDYTQAYKTINVYYFTHGFLEKYFKPALRTYLAHYDMSGYYEVILKVLINRRIKNLYAYNVNNTKWIEIDDAKDLKMAEYIFSENQLNLISKTWGGYWRYDFLDFCYLYNPYFPPEDFYLKMANVLPKLINNYPSGQLKLRKMLSEWYKEDGFCPDNLIIGNGASEFIRIINKAFVKKVTIPIPTFNEYENKLKKNQINYFRLSADTGFSLIKEDFVKSVRSSKSNAALIINPNNPTGSIIGRKDMIWILERLKDIIVIADESFIDFSGDRDRYSVQNLVNTYPRLVIVRSLSKEFGIPGLRLGYLLTKNKLIKELIEEHLPIWNINSMAEYFIENFINYQNSYNKSIQAIINNRKEFYDNLKGINYLKVFPSHANFFLCKLNGSAEELRQGLFNNFKILIKNCSNKKPFEKENYIRITVRTRQDNARLISALKSL